MPRDEPVTSATFPSRLNPAYGINKNLCADPQITVYEATEFQSGSPINIIEVILGRLQPLYVLPVGNNVVPVVLHRHHLDLLPELRLVGIMRTSGMSRGA